MNIWFLNHYAKPPSIPGGTRHYDFSVELNKRGHDCLIIASSFHSQNRKETVSYNDKEICKFEKINDVPFYWVKTTPYKKNNIKRFLNMLSYYFRAKKIADEIKAKPDFVVGSSVHLFAVLAAYKIAKKKKATFIMEVRDLWPKTLIDFGMSKIHPMIILFGMLERFLYKKAKKIITLLPGMKKYLDELGINNKKVVWISNGVNILREPEYYEANNLLSVMHCGSLTKGKQLEKLFDAAKMLEKENVKVQILGDGPEKEKLLRYVKDNRINNIDFLGSVPKEKVIDYLLKADILFTSAMSVDNNRFGISPNKIFDYLSAGKPVIFARESINNPVEEAQAGVTIPPGDPYEIVGAIRYLKSLPKKELIKMGKRGYNYVMNNYSIKKLVDIFENKILKE